MSDYKNIFDNTCNNNMIATIGWQLLFGETTYNFGYINSYLEAANDLIDKGCPDLYVYPIIFCYRQYIELSLKNICMSDMNKKDYIDFINKASHNLNIIWIEAKKHLNAFEITDPQNIDFINKLVNDFNKLDPTSFAFRYPQDKQMNKSLANNFSVNNDGTITQITVNLKNLHDNVELYDLMIRHTYDSI